MNRPSPTAAPATPSDRRGKRRRRGLRRILLLAALASIGFAAWRGAQTWLQRTDFFREALADEIRRHFAGEVEVASATPSFMRRRLEARDVMLRDRGAAAPQVILPEFEVKLPLLPPGPGEPFVPERVTVRRGLLRLLERKDGSFSPLDLIQVAAVKLAAPAVSIEEGTILLSGDGPVNALLDSLLREDLPRRVDNVKLAAAPMPESSDYVIGFNGSLELPGVTPVFLFGGIGRDNSMRIELEIKELDLASAALRGTLSPALAAPLERHVAGGRASIEVECDLPAAPGAEARFYVRLKAHDLRLRHSDLLQREITGASLEATFDGERLLLHELRFRDGEADVQVDGVIENLLGEGGFDLADWRLTVRSRRLAFRDSLVSAIREPELREIIDDFDPDGTAELFVEIARHDRGEPRVRWSLKPLAASASYVGHVRKSDGSKLGFPYRLTDLAGEIFGDGPHVEIRHVRGRHAGLGLVDIDGTVDVEGEHVFVDIGVRAESVPLADNRLRDALEHMHEGAGAIVDRFAPTGSLDFDVRVWTDRATHHTRRTGEVKPRGIDARFDLFPYSLHLDGGSVTFDDDRYELHSLRGGNGATSVTLDGSITAANGDVGIDLKVAARQARAQDPALRSALDHLLDSAAAGGARPFEWSWLDPAGAFDLDVVLRRDPGDAIRFRALLFPREMKAVPRWFGIPFEGVVGRVEFGDLDEAAPADRTFRLRLDGIEGTYRGAKVAATGSYSGDGALSLRVSGDRVEATPELVAEAARLATELFAGAPLDVGRALRDARPVGRVTFDLDAAVAQESVSGRLGLDLDGVRLAATRLPGGGASGVEGRLDVDLGSGAAVLAGLEGDLQGGCGDLRSRRLELAATERGFVCFGDVDLRGLPFDERSRALVPDRIRDALALAANGGRFDLAVENFALELPKGGAAPSAEFNAALRFDGCSTAKPVALESLRGTLLVAGKASLGADGAAAVKGKVEGASARVGGVDLEAIGADLALSASSIAVGNATGRVAGGSLQPDRSWIDCRGGSSPSITGNVALTECELASLLGQIGMPGGETRGRLSLDAAFRGDSLSLAKLGVTGKVSIRDGRLADIPWIATIYRRTLGLVLGEWLAPTFGSGDIDFRREGDRLRIDRFQLDARGPRIPVGLRLTGEGEVGLTGLNLQVVPEILPEGENLLGPLVRFLTEKVVSYRIDGPLRNPTVRYSNVLLDVLAPSVDETNLPRLVLPRPPDWSYRF